MRPLNVLFLSSDDLVAQVRLLPLLDILSASGRISYAVADRDMRLHGSRSAAFDVCLAHRNPGKRQMRWLRERDVPLLYDIDDLLLKTGDTDDPVRWCLTQAAVVTSPAPRLRAALVAAMDGTLANKIILLPNAGRENPPAGHAKSGKPKLIWISSALPQAASELDQVCQGIAEAAEKMAAETVLVGRFPTAIVEALPQVERVPWIAPHDLLDWIAQRPLIAIAPLSTDLQPSQQLFADCKSDIKIAQFGSSGVAGVYSNAAPYADSDLPRRLVQNDMTSWTNGILAAADAYPDEGASLAHDPAFARRRPSVLAAQLMDQLERAAASANPFAFRAIATPRLARTIERSVRRWLR